ncbi:hypothetical protein C0Q70_02993 [Pomacea canaliculata]|uniref:YEATS domain-containing protein 2 n=1 Tax=Pomacea canaliculata TaxID=400727 RepID=A0A2T7PRH1_POMCA|nr:hypothetical protein C0Q70_02993 [Pomacea canaliculata]
MVGYFDAISRLISFTCHCSPVPSAALLRRIRRYKFSSPNKHLTLHQVLDSLTNNQDFVFMSTPQLSGLENPLDMKVKDAGNDWYGTKMRVEEARKMTGKRSCVDLDPDYEDISEHQAKRQRVLEQDAKEASLKKIESIIWSQFKMETENIESDVVIIDQLLNQARSMMDRLRAVTVASYYSRLQQNPGKTSQTSIFPVNAIHPSVKKYLGKAPVATHVKTETVTSPHKDDKNRLNSASAPGHVPQQASTNLGQSQSETPAFSSESADVNRGSRFTEKKTIVVGNVSKHITDRQREVNDHSTHKWMVYVRGPRDNPSIHSFVSKVWFFLHPSYRPNDRVEISSPPFHLTRRGWGEFPVRVQLHFWDERNKRVDIIHNLKLDRSYTGLQTLGAETVVEIELLREFTGNGYSKLHHSLFSDSCLEETVIKEEKEDDGVEVQTGNTETCADVDASNMRLKDECLLDWVSKEVESDSTSYPCEITSATHKTTEVTIKQEPSELITGSHSNISYKTNDSTKGEHIMINRFKKPEPLPVLGSEKGTVTGRASGDTEAIPAKRNDGIEENDFVGDDASACVTSSNSAPFATLTKLKEANEVKERADSQCSMPRTRRWFSPDHILLPSSSQLSAPGDALVCVSSTSVGDGQLKIKLENEFFDKQSMETEKRILAWKDKKQKVPECRTSLLDLIVHSPGNSGCLGMLANSELQRFVLGLIAPKTKVKIKKAQGEDLSGTEIFPPSEEATFVQQTAAKIGVKFLPTLMQPNVMTHTCEDMIYAAMLEFSSEILSDACAAHVSSDKPLHTLTVPDVYQALVHMPFSALFTNEHLGSQEEISSCNR